MKVGKNNVAISIVSTARRLTAVAEECVFKPIKLSHTSVRIMDILRHRKSASFNEIVEIMGESKSNVSQRINTLVKQRLLKKVFGSDPKDKRKSEISLTAQGVKKMEEIERKMKRAQVHLGKIFSRRELHNHFAFFEKINRVLDEKEECIRKFLK